MVKFELTERMKDGVLNAVLIASLVMLIFGVAKRPAASRTESQPSSQYAVSKVSNLEHIEIPAHEEIASVPVVVEKGNTLAANAEPLVTTDSLVSAPNVSSSQNSTRTIQNRPVYKPKTILLSDTLNSALSITKLRIF